METKSLIDVGGSSENVGFIYKTRSALFSVSPNLHWDDLKKRVRAANILQ